MTEYRASDLGSCLRRRVATKLGYHAMDPPSSFAGIFARGKHWERIVVDHLRLRGFNIFDAFPKMPQDEGQIYVTLPLSESIVVTGHLDGALAKSPGDASWEHPRVLEIKSMAHDSFQRFVGHGWEMGGIMEKYKWQISAYMLATGWECVLIGVDSSSPEDDPHYHTVYVEKPFYNLAEVRARVLMAEAYMELPECDAPSYPCPFYYLGCRTEDVEDVDDAIEALASLVLEQDARALQEKNKADTLRQQLLADMGERKKMRTLVGTVSVAKSSTTVWDYDKMKKDGIDLDEYRTKRTGRSYVRIQRRAAADDGVAGEVASLVVEDTEDVRG